MSLPGGAPPDGSPSTPRLALAEAIAGLRGARGEPTLAPSAVNTPRVDDADTLEEGQQVRSPAPLVPGTDEAARLPITSRATYEVAGKFAQGGIGRILRAHDPVLGRTVALKELLVAGHRTDEERFVREVLLTARLQHPGIVPVYAAGRWPSGEPFYAMKLVSGRSFDQVLVDATTFPARLALLPHVLAIAETIAYAHAQGIIHRDLKPNNVLVGEFGETVVIDWGLAKQLGEPDEIIGESVDRERLSAQTPGASNPQQLTHVGAIVGTPGFMSPEQADSAAVDARTDVYALGVILYQTLTGRLPYDAENAVELLFKTVYEPPVALQRREPQVPEELAAIIEKAMARELAARYPTAKAFADDLRRFQTGQIVGAHRYTAWELLARVLRRYRNLLVVAAVAIVIVIVTATISFRSVAAQRDRALKAEAAAVVARNHAIERADVLALEQARLRADYDPALALDLLHRTSPGADWRTIRQIAAAVQQHGIPTVLYGHQAAVSRAVFSPDSTRLATTSDDCTLRVWNLADRTSRVFFGHTDEVWRASWSVDQRRVATTSRDRTVRVWDLDTGAVQVLVGHEASVRNVTFGPGGRSLYSADDARTLRRWDLDTGTGEVLDHCAGASFPWDENQVACLAEDNGVHVHDLRTGELTRLRAEGTTLGRNGSMSADGRWVAAGTTDAGVALWDRTTGDMQVLRLTGPTDDVSGDPREVRFSADAGRLLVPMATRVLATYNMADRTAQVLRPHTGYTRRAVFSPDAALIASVGGDVGVSVHDLAHDSDRRLVGAQALMIDVQFSRDGHQLASVGNDPRVFIWRDEVFRQHAWRLPGEGPALVSDAAGADISVLTRDLVLVVLDTATLAPRRQIALSQPLAAVAITPDGATVIGAGQADSPGDPSVQIWDARTGVLARTITPGAAAGVCKPTAAPDGRHVALVCGDGVLRWLDLATAAVTEVVRDFRGDVGFGGGELLLRNEDLRAWDPAHPRVRVLHRYFGPVQALASVPGRPQVVVASDRIVDIWDLARGDKRSLAGHSLKVSAMAVSADGRRLVTSSRDNILRLYDLESGALLRTITPNTLIGARISLSPTGDMLACATHDDKLSLWDLSGGPETRLEPRLLVGHRGQLTVLRFTADTRGLLVIDRDGRAIRWADDLPRDAEGVRAWVAAHHDPEAATPVTRTGCLMPTSDLSPGTGGAPAP